VSDKDAILVLGSNGTALLRLEQAGGGPPLDYAPSVLPVRADADGVTRERWAVGLARLDGAATYRVSRTGNGRMRCDCPDTTYGRAKRELRMCKHRVAVRHLMQLCERMTPMTETTAPPTNPRDDEAARIALALAQPFDPAEVKFKPQTISGSRALAVPYVDARVIQDRLDDVLGVMNWQDSYETLSDGVTVLCRLRVRVGGEWVTKEDVGGPSEQPDEGDRRKAAFSDALKRAAVKFGLGRYLYRMRPQWLDWDAQKRQFATRPVLPGAAAAPAAPLQKVRTVLERVLAFQQKLVAEALIIDGALLTHVVSKLGPQIGHDPRWWGQLEAERVEAECRAFAQAARGAAPQTPGRAAS